MYTKVVDRKKFVLKAILYLTAMVAIAELRLFAHSAQQNDRYESSREVVSKLLLTRISGDSFYILSSQTGNIYHNNSAFATNVRVLIDTSQIGDPSTFILNVSKLAAQSDMQVRVINPGPELYVSDSSSVPELNGYVIIEVSWDEQVLSFSEYMEWMG